MHYARQRRQQPGRCRRPAGCPRQPRPAQGGRAIAGRVRYQGPFSVRRGSYWETLRLMTATDITLEPGSSKLKLGGSKSWKSLLSWLCLCWLWHCDYMTRDVGNKLRISRCRYELSGGDGAGAGALPLPLPLCRYIVCVSGTERSRSSGTHDVVLGGREPGRRPQYLRFRPRQHHQHRPPRPHPLLPPAHYLRPRFLGTMATLSPLATTPHFACSASPH
jgi:hypothetical protein